MLSIDAKLGRNGHKWHTVTMRVRGNGSLWTLIVLCICFITLCSGTTTSSVALPTDGGKDGYLTFEQMEDFLRKLDEQYDCIHRKIELSKAISEERPALYAYEIGSAMSAQRTQILVNAYTDGRDVLSLTMALTVAKGLCLEMSTDSRSILHTDVSVVLIPALNVDALYANTRPEADPFKEKSVAIKNSNIHACADATLPGGSGGSEDARVGVWLSRNFADLGGTASIERGDACGATYAGIGPLSERETAALIGLVADNAYEEARDAGITAVLNLRDTHNNESFFMGKPIVVPPFCSDAMRSLGTKDEKLRYAQLFASLNAPPNGKARGWRYGSHRSFTGTDARGELIDHLWGELHVVALDVRFSALTHRAWPPLFIANASLPYEYDAMRAFVGYAYSTRSNVLPDTRHERDDDSLLTLLLGVHASEHVTPLITLSAGVIGCLFTACMVCMYSLCFDAHVSTSKRARRIRSASAFMRRRVDVQRRRRAPNTLKAISVDYLERSTKGDKSG